MSLIDIDLTRVKPRGTRVLVTAYLKPEMYKGLIVLPESHRRDETNSLFESVRASEKAIEALGCAPEEGDILATGPWAAVMITRDFGFVEAAQIRKRIAWNSGGEMSKALQAVWDQVIVEPDSIAVSKGGIHLAPSAEESPQTGVVYSVGPKVQEPLTIGTRVLFGRYSGAEHEHEGKTYLVMRESAILAELES